MTCRTCAARRFAPATRYRLHAGYGGLRPGELRALRWADVMERTILVQRATNPDGSIKVDEERAAPLGPAARAARPGSTRVPAHRGPPRRAHADHSSSDGGAWTRDDWGNWRSRAWHAACVRAGLDVRRPYDLRHSASSLWLAEGRQPLQVARWLGHSLSVLLDTYAHLIDELADGERVDAELEISKAREQTQTPVHTTWSRSAQR